MNSLASKIKGFGRRLDDRTIRLIVTITCLILFVLAAGAPGGMGGVGMQGMEQRDPIELVCPININLNGLSHMSINAQNNICLP